MSSYGRSRSRVSCSFIDCLTVRRRARQHDARMSDFDIDDDDDIDWDEAALIAEASVPSPAPVLAAESIVIASDHEAAVAAATTTTTTIAAPPQLAESHPKQQDEEELLILYDLLARADADDASAELVDDIEDLMVSSAAATGAGGAARRASRTLYDQFRKRRGFLLVTDLTAPGGWCEVQYSYSLLGRRDLKPEARVRSGNTSTQAVKRLECSHRFRLPTPALSPAREDRHCRWKGDQGGVPGASRQSFAR